ncbi:MAG: hypothetical protein IPL40_09365 [Proteobacteria bacterium]|nr:hypothetical protein [Pseudomonadota bacterium]
MSLAPLTRRRWILMSTIVGLSAAPSPSAAKAAPPPPTPVTILRVDDSTRCDLGRAAGDALARELGKHGAVQLLSAAPVPPAVDDATSARPAPPRRARRRSAPVRPRTPTQGLMLQVTACQERLGAGPNGRPRHVAFAKIAVSITVTQLPRQQLSMTTGAEAEVGVATATTGRLPEPERVALRRDALDQAIQRAVADFADSLRPAAPQRVRRAPRARAPRTGARPGPRQRRP